MSSVIKLSSMGGSLQPCDVYIIQPVASAAEEMLYEIEDQLEQPFIEIVEEAVPEIDPREEARMEAQVIIEAAQAEADAIRAQAFDQGLQEGRVCGETEWFAQMEGIAGLEQQLETEKNRFLTEIEPQVVKLSVEIAEKIIRHEISMNPEAVLDLVKGGLRQLRDKESVKIRVNPTDAEFIKQKRPDLIESFDGIRNLEIIDDRRVDQGGCVIDAPGGVLDVRVKSQLKEVERVVMEAATENAGNSNSGSE